MKGVSSGRQKAGTSKPIPKPAISSLFGNTKATKSPCRKWKQYDKTTPNIKESMADVCLPGTGCLCNGPSNTH